MCCTAHYLYEHIFYKIRIKKKNSKFICKHLRCEINKRKQIFTVIHTYKLWKDNTNGNKLVENNEIWQNLNCKNNITKMYENSKSYHKFIVCIIVKDTTNFIRVVGSSH